MVGQRFTGPDHSRLKADTLAYPPGLVGGKHTFQGWPGFPRLEGTMPDARCPDTNTCTMVTDILEEDKAGTRL